jgi:hypothetical protein
MTGLSVIATLRNMIVNTVAHESHNRAVDCGLGSSDAALIDHLRGAGAEAGRENNLPGA